MKLKLRQKLQKYLGELRKLAKNLDMTLRTFHLRANSDFILEEDDKE